MYAGTSSSHITWTHKGHRVLPSRTDGASRFRILNVGNEELHIRLLRPSDSGAVRCHFHDMNTGSRDSVTYHLRVIPSMSNGKAVYAIILPLQLQYKSSAAFFQWYYKSPPHLDNILFCSVVQT